MQTGDFILLFSEDESYVIEVRENDFHTKSGILSSKKILKSKFGDKIKTHLGKEFVILKPSLNDFLERIAERGPQIIMTKDASLILSKTGISPESLVVDGGAGSAYLSIFLANYINSGRVVTYETDKRWFRVAKRNIKNSGLKNIFLKKKDITKGISEKNVDLVTLDLQDSYIVVAKAHRALKVGGWLAVYSPHVEQVIQVTKEIKKKGFSEPKTFENIVREWKVDRTTHPKTIGLMHTGFLTFARKVR